MIQKSLGHLWTTTLDHFPLDVVAWHGNYAPYRYDLARFNTIGTIKNRTGATQPYGATSVVFDFGDVHVFTTAPQATTETIDLVEVSFWNKNR